MGRMGGAALLVLALATHGHAQNSVGLNVHVPGDDALDLARDAGVAWVRMDGNWWQLEPSAGNYRWEVLDGAIDGATARGLRVYLTLAYTPDWVTTVPRERTDTYSGNDEPATSAEWARFVEAAVRHYRARGVTHFGLWNEPNLGGFWDGNVDAYVDKIALPGAAAVRRACDDCVTLGPDLAHLDRVDLYLDRVLARASSGTTSSRTTVQPVPKKTGYTVFDGDSFFNAVDEGRIISTRLALRQVLDHHAWGREVWITETGYRANPWRTPASSSAKATYVRRVLEEQHRCVTGGPRRSSRPSTAASTSPAATSTASASAPDAHRATHRERFRHQTRVRPAPPHVGLDARALRRACGRVRQRSRRRRRRTNRRRRPRMPRYGRRRRDRRATPSCARLATGERAAHRRPSRRVEPRHANPCAALARRRRARGARRRAHARLA
ncbi:MAG: beta-galactosidase [Polyangiales bacterium]